MFLMSSAVRLTSISMLAGLLLAPLGGCGGGGGGSSPAVYSLSFVVPSPNAILTGVDDEDPATPELQLAVQVEVSSSEAGSVLELSRPGGLDPALTVALEGTESDTVVTFPVQTFANGPHTLVARIVGRDGETQRLSTSISFEVQLPGVEPGADPTLAFLAPRDGATLTDAEDADPAAPGFQTLVRVQAGNIPAGEVVRLTLPPTGVPVPVTVQDSTALNFGLVTLQPGANTLRVDVTRSGDGATGEATITVNVETTACAVVLTSALDGPCFNLASVDEDPAADGFQTTFTVSTDCAEATLEVDGVSTGPLPVVDGRALFPGVTLPEGEAVVSARARSGERSGASGPQSLTVDRVAPAVAFEESTGGVLDASLDADPETEGFQWVPGGTVAEDATSVQLVLSPGPDADPTLEAGASLGEGLWTSEAVTLPEETTWTARAQATDACGNVGESEPVMVFVDTVPPTGSWVQPAQDAVLNLNAEDADGETEGFQVVPEVAWEDNTGLAAADLLVTCSDGATFAEEGAITAPGDDGEAPGQVLWPALTLGDDVQCTFDATLTDLAGNVTVLTSEVRIDRVPPAIEGIDLLADANDDGILNAQEAGSSPGATATAIRVRSSGLEDGQPVRLGTDNPPETLLGEGVHADGAVDLTVTLEEGAHTLTADTADAAGNPGSFTRTIIVDTIAPELAWVTPLDLAVFNLVSPDADPVAPGFQIGAELAASDVGGLAGASLAVVCSSGASLLLDGTLDEGAVRFQGVTLADEDTCTLTATVTDLAGNPATASIEVIIDRVPPEVEGIDLLADANGDGVLNAAEAGSSPGASATGIRVRTAGLEDGLPVTLATDNPPDTLLGTEAHSAGAATLTVALAEGAHTLFASTADAAGNPGSLTRTLLVDTIAPDATWTTPLDGAVFNLASVDADPVAPGFQIAAALTWSDVNGLAAATIALSCTNGSTASVAGLVSGGTVTAPALTLPEDAICTLSAALTDPAGNTSVTTITVLVDRIPPTLAWVSPIANAVLTTPDDDGDLTLAGLQVDLVVSTDAPDGTQVSFRRTDGGSPAELGSAMAMGGEARLVATFTVIETVTVEARVEDSAGNPATASRTFSVDPLGVCDPAFVNLPGNPMELTAAQDEDANPANGVTFTLRVSSRNPVCNGRTVTFRSNGDELTGVFAAGEVAFRFTYPADRFGTVTVSVEPPNGTPTETLGPINWSTPISVIAPPFTVEVLDPRNGVVAVRFADSGAARYEVRASSSAITPANWDSLPAVPGQVVELADVAPTMEIIVEGLAFQQTTFLGLRARSLVTSQDSANVTTGDAFIGLRRLTIPYPFAQVTGLAALGDINNDGYEDFAVGGGDVPPNVDTPVATGLMIAYGGPQVATGGLPDLQMIPAPAGSDSFGLFPSTVGDVNGDGVGDFLVSGSPFLTRGTTCESWLFLGTTDAGSPVSTTPATRIRFPAAALPTNSTLTNLQCGTSINAGTGNVMDNPGDPSGAGLPDVLFGIPRHDVLAVAGTDVEGIVFVVTGRTTWPAELVLTENPVGNAALGVGTIYGGGGFLNMGRQLAIMSDANADGYDEILVMSSPSPSTNITPRIHYFQGRDLPITALNAGNVVRTFGPASSNTGSTFLNGFGVADINGDGQTDIFLSDFGNTSAIVAHVGWWLNGSASTILTRNDLFPNIDDRGNNFGMASVGDLRWNRNDPPARPFQADLVARYRPRVTTPDNAHDLRIHFNQRSAPYFIPAAQLTLFTREEGNVETLRRAGDVDGNGFSDIVFSYRILPTPPTGRRDAIILFY
jgi:hypothetical protein